MPLLLHAILELLGISGVLDPLAEKILRRLGLWNIDADKLPSGTPVAVVVLVAGLIVLGFVVLISSAIR